MPEQIILIAALGVRTRVIGKNNYLPWRIPADMKRFKETTMGHPVIMGRSTRDSIPPKFWPLDGRTNIVLSRQVDYKTDGALVANSLDSAFALARESPGCDKIYVIGGGQIYNEAIYYATHLDLTLVDSDVEGDTFFPVYEKRFTSDGVRILRSEGDLSYRWEQFVRR